MNRNTRKPCTPLPLPVRDRGPDRPAGWCALTLLLCGLIAPAGALGTTPAKANVGTYTPSQAMFLLDANGNFNWDGAPPDLSFPWASPNFISVVGDWNGSGTKKVGLFDPATATRQYLPR